jgi:hypothetical protein
MAAISEVQHREVVVFSGAQPKYLDFSTSHRGELRKDTKRQEFSIHDPAAGATYHAAYNQAPTGPSSPRHHHDFEQIRFVLAGDHEYGGKHYSAGWLGYFGEGVYYGPQAQHGPGRSIVLQFPGPSGGPFHSREESRRAQGEMLAAGAKFEGGICIWPDGRKQDGADALHGWLNGRPMEFPPARYAEQVWMNTENYPWETSNVPGVAVKRLAFFNDRGPAVQLLRLEPGASTPPGKTGSVMIRQILEGEATYAGQPCPAVSGLHYPADAPYEGLFSATGATILSIELQAKLPGSEPPLPYRI